MLLRELSVSGVTLLVENSGSLLLVSMTLPHVFSVFADFTLGPVPIINHSHDYDCLLSLRVL